MYKDIQSLNTPLPADILALKHAGYFGEAVKLIDHKLEGELPGNMAGRLRMEKEIMNRLPGQYTYDRESAIAWMREIFPDFTGEELDRLESKEMVEYIFVDGKKHYYRRFRQSLIKAFPEYAERAGRPMSPSSPWIDEPIAILREKGELAVRIRAKTSGWVEDYAFTPGETYDVWLPIPKPSAQQSEVRILATSHKADIAPETAPQRTVHFREQLAANERFWVEYDYVSRIRYTDAYNAVPAEAPVYPAADPISPADLAEQLPHIPFSPALRALAAQIAGDEKNPLALARRVYDFVTLKVRYAFAPDYTIFDCIAEYAASNRQGDCGIQTILFIALCRILGVPARWQSSLTELNDSIGNHDWAQFYTEEYGWLFCDCSYGGGAHRVGNEARRQFYFGNIEPYRMVACSDFQQPFQPATAFIRNDPYDGQLVEIQTATRPLPSRDVDTEFERIAIETL